MKDCSEQMNKHVTNGVFNIFPIHQTSIGKILVAVVYESRQADHVNSLFQNNNAVLVNVR